VLQLYTSRLEVCQFFSALNGVIPLLEQMDVDGMSPDHSDSENITRERLTSQHPYKRDHVPWRHQDLDSLLHDLDPLSVYIHNRPGHKSKGNWKRYRKSWDNVADTTLCHPARGLPEHCFDEGWIAELPGHELEELEVGQHEDLDPIRLGLPPHLRA